MHTGVPMTPMVVFDFAGKATRIYGLRSSTVDVATVNWSRVAVPVERFGNDAAMSSSHARPPFGEDAAASSPEPRQRRNRVAHGVSRVVNCRP